MKLTLTAAAALSMMVTSALADSKVAECTLSASLAKSAMELRQTGTDLPTVVGALSQDLDGGGLSMAIEIMQIAYSEPLYSSDQAKERAANEFSSGVFLVCMESEK